MNIIIFYILAAVILIFSVLSVTSRRILRAATYLLFVLIATAGFYFLMEVNFLASVQLMLYAGGITVLIVFSILLTSNIDHKFEKSEIKKNIFSVLLVALGAGVSLSVLLNKTFNVKSNTEPVHVKKFGYALLNYGENGFVLPFEVISLLLLAAMIAAIMIAKKR
ncbi:MAG: NADH-quinone oxidoreductase subunit J [Bacteroidales bacterium]|nr:NADH-quinone oxidoreductase subunit J [Bacteroidales bacterium]